MLRENVSRHLVEIVEPMVLSAMRIAVLLRVCKGKELIEECALAITHLTENEKFVLAPHTVVPHVVLAAKVHLQNVSTRQTQLSS